MTDGDKIRLISKLLELKEKDYPIDKNILADLKRIANRLDLLDKLKTGTKYARIKNGTISKVVDSNS